MLSWVYSYLTDKEGQIAFFLIVINLLLWNCTNPQYAKHLQIRSPNRIVAVEICSEAVRKLFGSCSEDLRYLKNVASNLRNICFRRSRNVVLGRLGTK